MSPDQRQMFETAMAAPPDEPDVIDEMTEEEEAAAFLAFQSALAGGAG